MACRASQGRSETQSNMAKKSGFLKWIIIVVVLLLLVGGGVSAYFLRGGEKPISVQAEKSQKRSLTELVTATGKIQPVLQVAIAPEVSGEIIELGVIEGQKVRKGDLLVRIKPDNYIASTNSAFASMKSSQASVAVAEANLDKAEKEWRRNQELFNQKLVSASVFQEYETSYNIAKSQLAASKQQSAMTSATLARSLDDLAKTTIFAPLDGTVSRLKSQKGERVVGTGMMAGTEIMTIADLDAMEARVDIGEMDVVLIKQAQTARLEVDAFRDRKFVGKVYEIANSSKQSGMSAMAESIRFEVKIRITDKEEFRPGMSVTAQIETRSRTDAVSIPIQSVTTRLPKEVSDQIKKEQPPAMFAAPMDPREKELLEKRRKDPSRKPIEVVFVAENGVAKMKPVKRGISDDNFVEIVEGLADGDLVITGGFKAINRDLEDGKAIKIDDGTKAKGGFSISSGDGK